jgi:hypothetical protein
MHNGKTDFDDKKIRVSGVLENGLICRAGVVISNDGWIVSVSANSLKFEKK